LREMARALACPIMTPCINAEPALLAGLHGT